jgi:threonine synthase
MKGASYPEVAFRVISKFLTDYTAEELREYIGAAYDPSLGGRFSHPLVAPVTRVREHVSLLELYHGPTCAFEDFALQLLPYLLTAAVRKCGEDNLVVILVATSGDTGKAALEGFADVPGTGIFVFYPDGGTSDIQRLQMVTQHGNNVGVLAVKGNFDDAQTGVKRIFTDKSFIAELGEKGVVLSSQLN